MEAQMDETPYGRLTLEGRLNTMRGCTFDAPRYVEMRAELDRRQALARIHASSAQVRAAWFQLAASIRTLRPDIRKCRRCRPYVTPKCLGAALMHVQDDRQTCATDPGIFATCPS